MKWICCQPIWNAVANVQSTVDFPLASEAEGFASTVNKQYNITLCSKPPVCMTENGLINSEATSQDVVGMQFGLVNVILKYFSSIGNTYENNSYSYQTRNYLGAVNRCVGLLVCFLV